MTAPSRSRPRSTMAALAGAICLSCTWPASAQSTDGGQAASNFLDGVRLRGAAKELSIARGESAYADSEPASFTLQHDLQNDTETHSAQAFLGYELLKNLPERGNIVPYIGLIKSKYSESGVFDAERSTEQRKFGVSADIFWHPKELIGGMGQGYQFTGALERSNDHVDLTRMTTASVILRPYIWFANRTFFPTLNKNFWVHPILTLRFDAIDYSRRSLFPALAVLQEDARRAGGEVGFAMHTNKPIRLSYSFRYLKLHDWKGESDASHASHAIEALLDEDGNARVVLRFDRGRPEDTFEPERVTSLLLALRY